MTKKLNFLFLFYFLSQTSTLFCNLNLDEINPSIKNLTEFYNLQSTFEDSTTSPIESIDLTMRLLEKASHDLVPEKFSQKIYLTLHKHLPFLTSAIVFEKNYAEISDFTEELFNCEIKILNKKETLDFIQPQITPFRYPLIYAVLAISKIALQKQLNPNQDIDPDKMKALKTKLLQNFKNAFSREKISLQSFPHITLKRIYKLYNAIELLIPTKETNSMLNPLNWNFSKIATVVGMSCGIVLTVYLAKLLSSTKKTVDELPETLKKTNTILDKTAQTFGDRNDLATQPGTLTQTLRNLESTIGTQDNLNPNNTASLTQLLGALKQFIGILPEASSGMENPQPDANLRQLLGTFKNKLEALIPESQRKESSPQDDRSAPCSPSLETNPSSSIPEILGSLNQALQRFSRLIGDPSPKPKTNTPDSARTLTDLMGPINLLIAQCTHTAANPWPGSTRVDLAEKQYGQFLDGKDREDEQSERDEDEDKKPEDNEK